MAQQRDVDIELIDVFGRILDNIRLSNITTGHIHMKDLSLIPAGIYFYRIKQQENQQFLKFIKN